MDASRFRIAWTLMGVLSISFLCAEANEKIAFNNPLGSFTNQSKIDTVSQKIDKVDNKLDQIAEKNISGSWGGKNAPSRGCPGRYDTFSNFTFLYWQAFNHGFVFAFENLPPALTPTGHKFTNSRMYEVKHDWEPGVRWGVGYNSHYDAWDVEAIWTWIRFENSRRLKARLWDPINGLGLINPPDLGGEFEEFDPFLTAFGFWRLNYNTGDLELRRSFFQTKALSFKAMLSFRGASLAQVFKTAFMGQPEASELDGFRFKGHTHFWGFGPRLGVNAEWHLPKNFSFTGLVSGALLFGKQREKTVSLGRLAGSLDGGVWEQIGSDFSSYFLVAPTAQILLGLNWGQCVVPGRIYFGLNAAWELNYWWNQMHASLFQKETRSIEIQGLTITAELHF